VIEGQAKPRSDLGVRTASAIVMIFVAALALWLGGAWFDGFAIVTGVICFAEYIGLTLKIFENAASRLLMGTFGVLYIGLAIYLITQINSVQLLLLIVGSVVCVDIFAYIFGRTIGGPKIAPRISPSKTWAGLTGGIFGATLALSSYFYILNEKRDAGAAVLFDAWPFLICYGVIIAVLAQSGDFFESWLKRKAGVKDSSRLIPGHGGVFDRIDGMLPISIVFGLLLVTYFPHWLNR
jgi:phosphatidate cytidylyltransferase